MARVTYGSTNTYTWYDFNALDPFYILLAQRRGSVHTLPYLTEVDGHIGHSSGAYGSLRIL